MKAEAVAVCCSSWRGSSRSALVTMYVSPSRYAFGCRNRSTMSLTCVIVCTSRIGRGSACPCRGRRQARHAGACASPPPSPLAGPAASPPRAPRSRSAPPSAPCWSARLQSTRSLVRRITDGTIIDCRYDVENAHCDGGLPSCPIVNRGLRRFREYSFTISRPMDILLAA